MAARHPERVASLTVLAPPHPAAFRRAFREDVDDQRHRSRDHTSFHDPMTATLLLEDGARRLRQRLGDRRVPTSSIEEYVSVLGESAALEAALAWYRAAGALTNAEVGPVAAPTLYLRGDADATVGRAAAEWTVTKLLLEHLARAR